MGPPVQAHKWGEFAPKEREAPLSPAIVGVVLAAGASRRAGFPKALATLQGETLLGRACATLHAGGCSAVHVVLGAPHEELIRTVANVGVRWLHNPDPGRGMSSSLAVALVEPSVACASAVMVSLLDHPLVRPATLRRLIEHWRATSAPMVRPRFEGRGGHPYLLSRDMFPAFLALPRGFDPRPLFQRYVLDLDVDDPGVVDDADRPGELDALGVAPPRR